MVKEKSGQTKWQGGEQVFSFGVHTSNGGGKEPMQSQKRKAAGCMNCGEVRDIAAHGLCFTGYRRHARTDAKAADPHNPNREQRTYSKKMLKSTLPFCREWLNWVSDLPTSRRCRRNTAVHRTDLALIGDRGPEGGDGKGDDAHIPDGNHYPPGVHRAN